MTDRQNQEPMVLCHPEGALQNTCVVKVLQVEFLFTRATHVLEVRVPNYKGDVLAGPVNNRVDSLEDPCNVRSGVDPT